MHGLAVDRMSSVISVLNSQAQQLQSNLPLVAQTLFFLSNELNAVQQGIRNQYMSDVMEGNGPAAMAVKANLRYLDLTQPLGENITRSEPNLAFEPLWLKEDHASPLGNNPLIDSKQWLFPLVMTLAARGSLNSLPYAQFGVVDRSLTVEHRNNQRGWDTTLKFGLPDKAMHHVSFSGESHSRIEAVDVALRTEAVGYHWLRQNVIRPLYEANGLDPAILEPFMCTVGSVREWLVPLCEARNLAELRTRMPFHRTYALDDVNIYKTISLRNMYPLPGQEQTVWDITVTFPLYRAYFEEQAPEATVSMDVDFGYAEAQVGVFHSTPFINNRCKFSDLPWDYQRQIMDQLPHRLEQELDSYIAMLKRDHADIFEPREDAE